MADDSPFLDDEEAAELENRRQLAAIGNLPANNANGLLRGRPRRGRRPAITPAGNAMPMFDNAHEGSAIAGTMHAQQGNALQGAIKQATDAIRDENDRKVAISREMRRMEHEKQLKKMEQDTERMKIDALLQRLRMESGAMPRVSGEGFSIY